MLEIVEYCSIAVIEVKQEQYKTDYDFKIKLIQEQSLHHLQNKAFGNGVLLRATVLWFANFLLTFLKYKLGDSIVISENLAAVLK